MLLSCNNSDKSIDSFSDAPAWSSEVVWYQIFVERFRNGDPNNDPTPDDLIHAYPDAVPENWKITPWGHDWYKPDAWFNEVESDKFWDRLQLRRYGGDLQGVLDKLDYLQDLGITAIYFNPLNDAPSMHKYDPRHWRHIDRNFGPDPKADMATIASENPADPDTWKFTTADSLFLQVIDECHKRNIRIILDYSWNHTGKGFWALDDIRENGPESEFADWYDIESYDNPKTPEDEFHYKGWYGIKYLPEIKKAIIGQDSVFPFEGNLHSQAVKNHIFAVAKRWLDPNGDGNPADGIDGYRLDVAAEIPLGFWPEFRKEVRNINPEAYLIGEIWWQEWPDKLMEPQQFLSGDKFDAIMNYRWYRVARQFFAKGEPAIGPQSFVDSIHRIEEGIRLQNRKAMMNLTSSHDSPRTSTALYNKNQYKNNSKPYANPNYKIDKPDAQTKVIQKMLLVQQFTYVGAPHIWYGDEVGMWGGDDPDCRKPMVWDDLTYETESTHPDGLERNVDVVEQDMELLSFIKQLIKIRTSNPVFINGDMEFILADDAKELLAYRRTMENVEAIVLFNLSDQDQQIKLDLKHQYKSLLNNEIQESNNIHIKKESANVLLKIN